MNIPELSVARSMAQTTNLNTAWGIRMMAKSIDSVEDNGAALTKMMESSVMPNLGQHIDVKL